MTVPARRADVLAQLAASGELNATGLAIRSELDFDEWETIGYVLGKLHHASRFGLGDWMLYGERVFGEAAAQAAETTSRSPATLAEYVRVAAKIPPSRRRAALSFTHHQLVASRPPAEQDRLLDLAERERLSVPELRGRLRALPAREPAEASPHVLEEAARALLHSAAPPLDERGRVALVPVAALVVLADALGERWPG